MVATDIVVETWVNPTTSISTMTEAYGHIEKDFKLLETSRDLPDSCNEILERLRTYSTKKECLEAFSNDRAVAILSYYGFANSSSSDIAIRCLCNLLLQVEGTRQFFVNGGYHKKAVRRMKTHLPNCHDNLDLDHEFTSARLLLLCTYETNLDFNVLLDDYNLAGTMKENISWHARTISSTGPLSSDAALRALSESLKLLYNLLSTHPSQIWRFQELSLSISKILETTPISSPPLQPPVSLLINTLIHLDLDDQLFPAENQNVLVDKLVHILDLATQYYDENDIDLQASPLVQVLLRLYEAAPYDSKLYMRTLLLPSQKDREIVLGQGDSLPSRLLSLFNKITAPNLHELLPALYYDLSNKSVQQFVNNVGFGLAAGYLRSIDLESGISEHGHPHRQEEATGGTDYKGFNSITGQRRDKEPQYEASEMTQEEKEREAERLFVLFDRLQRNGIMTVEHPITRAVEQGRFEELG